MRVLLFLFWLFVVHRLLVQTSPPYRELWRAFDQKVTLITIMLVIYLVVNFVYIIFFR
ncbi:hypothetical protein NKDENANG_03792 [Candidatus Entotheonellaceae bacterium PAL068K]